MKRKMIIVSVIVILGQNRIESRVTTTIKHDPAFLCKAHSNTYFYNRGYMESHLYHRYIMIIWQ